MQRVVTALLILVLAAAAGCSRPAPTLEAATETVPRRSSSASSDYLAWTPDLQVRAELRWEPSVSELLPDPATGVWAGQDGELFHFAIRSRAQAYQRVTYGRPDPASVWTGNLIWLAPDRLAGLTTTFHLLRWNPDGTMEDLGAARSPGGFLFDLLDAWDGKLRLRDAAGTWFTLASAAEGIVPLSEPLPLSQPRHSGLDSTAQERMERQANGRFVAWGVDLPDRTAYALISREQLFTFDLTHHRFTLIGTPEQFRPVPLGAVDGRIAAWSSEGVLLIEPDTGSRQMIWKGDVVGVPYLAPDGWLYALPHRKINLRTGEEEQLPPLRLTGGVSAVVQLSDGRLAAGTGHGGSVFLADLATGEFVMFGRPLPELGQESGEEMAPIAGLAEGKDGLLYALVGPGAGGHPYAHLVRINPFTGETVDSMRVEGPLHSLVSGADGRLYASARGRVVWIED